MLCNFSVTMNGLQYDELAGLQRDWCEYQIIKLGDCACCPACSCTNAICILKCQRLISDGFPVTLFLHSVS